MPPKAPASAAASRRGSRSSARVIHSRWPQRPASTFTAPSRPRIYIMECTAEFTQRPLHPPAQRREDFVSGQNSASRLDRVLGPRRPVLRRAIAGIASDRISVTGTGVRRIGRRTLISIARTTWVSWLSRVAQIPIARLRVARISVSRVSVSRRSGSPDPHCGSSEPKLAHSGKMSSQRHDARRILALD